VDEPPEPRPSDEDRPVAAGVQAIQQKTQEMTLRAYDVSERTARRGRASAVRRLDRWRSRWFLIAQTAVTAGLTWFLAQHVLHHPAPFFAPVAAIVTLGVTFGQRMRRGVEIAIGVAVGVLVGDIFVRFFGSGVWQIIVVVVIAMTLASLLGAGQLMIIQASVQSVLIITLSATNGQALSRWLDAVIGAVIALLVATVAPSAPLRRPAQLAADVLQGLAATLKAAATELRVSDQQAGEVVLEQARSGEGPLARLAEATAEGLAVVRISPFRRHQLPGVLAYEQLYDPLDHASRNMRVLARRCAVALWRGETVPATYVDEMEQLADIALVMAEELRFGRLPTAQRKRLVALGRASSHLPLSDSLSPVVILAQVRSITADLLELTGLDYAEARALIPDMG
jgi:uncharacterized membrane protein YgaE (UPF0421/DUF939 family)